MKNNLKNNININVIFAYRLAIAAQGYDFQVGLVCCAAHMFSSIRMLGPAWRWVVMGGGNMYSLLISNIV